MASFHNLKELLQLESLLEKYSDILRFQELACSNSREGVFPIYKVSLGDRKPGVPTVAFVGGIHGLERIGTQIILAFMETLTERVVWDEMVQTLLQRINIVFLPLMNPVGMQHHRRSNGNGVDLMRNAPIDGEGTTWLAGGQRITPMLPWYRGDKNRPMEREAQVLVDSIRGDLFSSPFSLVVDCHSGFGMRDRIWFPFACTNTRAIPHLPEIYEIRSLLFNTYPNLSYLFEPQSKHYTTHGDLWDFLYNEAIEAGANFLPFTLELGSWLWVKKNPAQIRSALGMFHPIQPHRIKRVLRHHQVLFEFFLRIAYSYERWQHTIDRPLNLREAHELWYSHLNLDRETGWISQVAR